ncbi:MAG TPA: aminotransferase class IV, partial [Holophagaceae bacterium]|nr:aminotransferase class IV [Holophagaceae bacterium]
VWALLEPVPDTPSPYRLAPLPHPQERPHPLAPHKGLLGTWNLDLLREAEARGADDALLFRPGGVLVETAIAALALEVADAFWLPLSEGRVASLAERLEFPEWAGAKPVRTRAFTLDDLSQGHLWCFNAVRGIWPGTPL